MNSPNPSPPTDEPDPRVQRLEEQIAFQQRTIEELHSEVLAQQSAVDVLRLEVARLQAVVQRMSDQGWGEDLPHEKPPHY